MFDEVSIEHAGLVYTDQNEARKLWEQGLLQVYFHHSSQTVCMSGKKLMVSSPI